MLEKRVKIQSVIENQLPDFIRSENQKFGDFLKTYYKSTEYQGGPVNILENIDQYVKVGTYTSIVEFTFITADIGRTSTTIPVSSTIGWPDTYGLLKIDNEIISYTGKTAQSFTGCIRGFCGITSYSGVSGPDELIFEESQSSKHTNSAEVINISSLFLKEFFKKLKTQFLPGLENRDLSQKLNVPNFIRQAKDFYSSKGTENAFEILFRALYEDAVQVIKPQDYLFIPSDAGYRRALQLTVESVSGDPSKLQSKTVFQTNQSGETVAYGSVIDVENINRNNKNFYRINIDFNDDKDTSTVGSLYGNFVVDPQTKVIDGVSIGSTYMDVESTIGFAQTGELYVTYSSGNTGIVTYSSKNITQFTNLIGVNESINDTQEIFANTSCYGFDDEENKVQFRIKGSIGDYVQKASSVDVPYLTERDKIKIQSLGYDVDNKISDSLFYNESSTFDIKNASILTQNQLGQNPNIISLFQFETFEKHGLTIGDTIKVITDQLTTSGIVNKVISDYSFDVSGLSGYSPTKKGKVKRIISKTYSQDNNVSQFPANIVKSFFDDNESVYFASHSLPYYKDPINVRTGVVNIGSPTGVVLSGDTITANNHGFVTGEEIQYIPDIFVESVQGGDTLVAISTVRTLGTLVEGSYFVKIVDQNNFKLSASRAGIFSGRFESISGIASFQQFYPVKSYNNSLDSSYGVRKIPYEVREISTDHEVKPGLVGTLINGVDILSYKSEDHCYYGNIETIEVTAGGNTYDVVNPPKVIINDIVGVGATATATVIGELESIEVLDSGSDFTTDPIITITGGNGSGAVAKANTRKQKIVAFTDTSSGAGFISTSTNVIGFSTYHRFRHGDAVIYSSNSQTPIGIGTHDTSTVRDLNLVNGSTYYVATISLSSIKLHNKKPDALAGINTINITDFGRGYQYFTTVDLKNVLSSITVERKGQSYTNNSIRVSSSGINSSRDLVAYNNHGFSTGEVITYNYEGTSVSGLTTNQNYYVSVLDDNSFKLSAAGIGTTLSDYNYHNNIFVDIKDVGVGGTHIFSYPPIQINITGNIGIDTTNNAIFNPTVSPKFRGSITKINLEKSGIGYGCSDIINFERQPLILFETGTGAQLKPIVSNGKISEVFVINGGSNYFSQPSLKISGSGSNASLSPIVRNGSIVSVQINDGGSGFTTHTTFVEAISNGSGAKVRTKIRKWTVNNFERYKNYLSVDDGVLIENKNQYSRGSYAVMSAPRALREIIYAKSEDGTTKYGADSVDLRKIGNVEVSSENHSPIIGWAFDGCPIYGPYGYDTPSGGSVRALASGYELLPSSDRPPAFSNGFFVEDYVFIGSGDLDERNGRFTKTPDYPLGTYAYFATINPGPAEGFGPFRNYKLPQFPYVIGPSFRGKPDEFNYDRKINQIDYNYNLLVRNSRPSKTSRSFGYSEYINDSSSDPKQYTEVTSVTKGSVTGFSIVSAGSSYKSGEILDIEGSPLYGPTAKAEIDSIRGKNIVSLASTSLTVDNFEIYVSGGLAIGYCTSPHNLENKNTVIISGLSTHTYGNLNGFKAINNPKRTWYLNEYLASPATTGLTTTISLIGSYDPLYFRENTIIGIGISADNLEKLKVLNIDPLNQKVRVQRQYDGTIGAAYSSRTLVLEYQSTFSFPVGFNTFIENPPKLQRYFNPTQVVGLGTTISVGIGTTISYHQLNNIAPPNSPQNNSYKVGTGFTSLVVSLGSILIHNHSFNTGDSLLYSNGGGSSVQVSNGSSTFTLSDQSTVYAIKESEDIIGISTTKVGLGSTGSYVGLGSTAVKLLFTSVGTGVTHSFTLVTNSVTANASSHEAIMTTEDNHGLVFSDEIVIVSKPNKLQNVFVQYNDYNRRIVFDRKKFEPSEINTITNTINIPNHGFEHSQKVIYTTTGSSPSGLTSEGMYYVIPIDSNNLKLSSEKVFSYSPNPTPVRISSSGSGEHFLSKINPSLNVYSGNTISFGVTDRSLSATSVGTTYSAFKLEFFKDSEYKDQYVSSQVNKEFEVVAIGTVGTTDPAAVNVSTNDISPSKLYYKFTPINVNTIPSSKSEIFIDPEQSFANLINIIPSVYNAVQYPTGIGSTTFRYLLNQKPEASSYQKTDGTFYYITKSKTASGPIETIKIKNSGRGYESLPGVSSIHTSKGSNGIVRLSGDMGKIRQVSVKDTGYNYPSDPTFKIIANAPEILQVEALNSFESIGIVTGGRDFLVPPNLVVIDSITNNVIDDITLIPKIKNGTITNVEIARNTKSLSDSKPNILSVNNSNGVGINTVGFNTLTKEVTVQFSVGFSTANSFPFSAGDRVYVENIGVSSGGSGYNSSDYGYKFFELTSIDANIGGIGSATYKLDSSVTDPGAFSTAKSYGRMIPFSSFPVFDPKLIKNNFSVGEAIEVLSHFDTKAGNVSSWDSSNKILKVNSKEEYKVGEKIIGRGSGTTATIVSKLDINSYFNIDAAPLVTKSWTKNTGKLNIAEQRIIDSDYYQYFSYSVKSKIAYDTWNDVVSSLNHTSGFKKFSDLIIESQSDNTFNVSVNSNDLESIIELISEIETYCVFDFDLVSEKTKQIGNNIFSDEVLLQNVAVTDFEESVGNRVLSIDSISGSFNNTPRGTRYSVVDRFPLIGTRFRKYFIMLNDTQFIDERQMSIVEVLIDNEGNGYVQEYGDLQTQLDGYFDYQQIGSEGQLLFYPSNYEFNDYELHGLVYNIDRGTHGSVGIATFVGVTTVGDIVSVESRGTTLPAGITTSVNILGFSTTNYESSKLLITVEHGNRHEVLNMNLVHHNNQVYGVEYGHIVDNDLTTVPGPSLGTFGANISGGVLYLNFTPVGLTTVGSAVTFHMLATKFHAGVSTVGIDTTSLVNGDLRAEYKDIAASASPGITTIARFGANPEEDAAYGIIQIYDVTSDRYEMFEVLFLADTGTSYYQTMFGSVEDDNDNIHAGIGTIGVINKGGGLRHVVYTPPASKRTIVKTFLNSTTEDKGGVEEIYLVNIGDSSIESMNGTYTGTQTDVLRAFGLFHGGDPIFIKTFDSTNPNIVDTINNLIVLPNHFFTSGERLKYVPTGTGTTSSIGIGTTTITGYGSTDKLPEYVYAIKIDDKSVRLAATPEDALVSNTGNYLKLTTVGIGISHSLISQDQNSKCIVALDNNIQDPVIPANITHTLAEEMSFGGELVRLSGITSFFGGDLLKVENEFMTIKQVGFGSTNVLVVQRAWMGTGLSTHPIGATVEKYEGGYNIVGNTINFYTAPIGTVPKVTDDPDELDWTGIQTSSTFQGRVFIRNGVIGASTHTYATNYIFDSISPEFTGVGKTFTMKQNGIDVSGFSTSHSLVLINDIVQIPTQGSRINDFSLTENAGITSVVFSGFAASVRYDVRTGTVPVGGVLAAVGSSQGFGYQPLVQAGGTAIISGFGTIVSISIGNSGSGYRAGIATLNGVVQPITVNVGVRTADLDVVDIVSIGIATISNGRITGISVTNPGVGYTFTNPPIVIIDEPIPYTNIPLIYHSQSTGAGLGTNAKVDIQVSFGSSVVNFDVTNSGYGYRNGEILTIPTGGITGIPTDSTVGAAFSDFRLSVDSVSFDKFTAWRFGDLDVLDPLDDQFDGSKRVFTLRKESLQFTIRAKKGSLIDVDQTILVFLNNILQEPGTAYIFRGGSNITFTEAPKVGDTCRILFYRGTGSVDVITRDILDTIKVGDKITFNSGNLLPSVLYQQNERSVTGILTADNLQTSPYADAGITTDTTIFRPLTWCKQQEDLVVDGQFITKDRPLYEPSILPNTNIIKSVGVGSTEIWVQNVIPLFNSYNESLESPKQTVEIFDEKSFVGASATAVVSGFGTISSISITNTGLGYTIAPTVALANPVGLGSTTRATATASISTSTGAVTSISVSSAGAGYTFTNPPVILIEYPKFDTETITNVNYSGDFGIITGVATTSVGIATTGLVFDLFIPLTSPLRSSAYMGPSGIQTISNIAGGYPFVVYNSNVGNGVTSLNLSGSTYCIGTSFLDNVYEAVSVSIATTSVVGYGTTYVAKVVVSLSSYNGLSGIGFSNFYGEYSWGKIRNFSRSGIAKSFTPNLNNGITGILTSPTVSRKTPLKTGGYLA